MDFSETIEVKVLDGEETLSVDSYFFAYFQDLPAALEQIREAVSSTRYAVPQGSQSHSPLHLIDTTVTSNHRLGHLDRVQSTPEPRLSSSFRLSSLLRPFHDTPPINRTTSTPEPLDTTEEFTHVEKRDNTSFIPITSSTESSLGVQDAPASTSGSDQNVQQSPDSLTPTPSNVGHTYPPSTATQDDSLSPLPRESSSSWNVGVPSWLRLPSRRVFSSPFSGSSSTAGTLSEEGKGVTEIYSSTISSSTSRSGTGQGELGFSILETPEITVDAESAEKFKASFAFDDRETLLGCTQISLNTEHNVDLDPSLSRLHLPYASGLRSIICLRELSLF